MTHNLFYLTGRTALVTGSSRGLGRAIAEGLAKAGARLIVNGVDPARLAAPKSISFASAAGSPCFDTRSAIALVSFATLVAASIILRILFEGCRVSASSICPASVMPYSSA